MRATIGLLMLNRYIVCENLVNLTLSQITKMISYLTQPNPNLNYLNQNLGVPVKEYYTVDYKKFNHEQMKAMCCLIFGQQSSEIPHPINEWKHFLFKIGNITPYFFQSITCPVNTTILTLTLSTHILYFN